MMKLVSLIPTDLLARLQTRAAQVAKTPKGSRSDGKSGAAKSGPIANRSTKMHTFTTITVPVTLKKPGGSVETLQGHRPLRVVTSGPHANRFAVSRKGRALLVSPTTDGKGALADLSEVVDLSLTRAARMADLGLKTQAQAKAEADAGKSDGDLVAGYAKIGAVQGPAFLANMAKRVKDPRKAAALKTVLAIFDNAKTEKENA